MIEAMYESLHAEPRLHRSSMQVSGLQAIDVCISPNHDIDIMRIISMVLEESLDLTIQLDSGSCASNVTIVQEHLSELFWVSMSDHFAIRAEKNNVHYSRPHQHRSTLARMACMDVQARLGQLRRLFTEQAYTLSAF